MEEQTEELTIEEVIKYAMRIEQESFQFYRKASRMLEGNELKSLTDGLAEQELDHFNRLRNLLNEGKVNYEELAPMLNVETSLFERIIQTGEIPAGATSMDVLSIALEREKNTERIYEMLLRFSTIGDEIKGTFRILRDMEEIHVRNIQNRIEQLKGKGI